MAERREHFSFSKLDLFEKCPAQWAARYVRGMKVPELQTWPMKVGKAAHAIIIKYVEHLHASGLQSDPEIVSTITEEVFSTDPEVSTAVYNDAFRIAHQFARQYSHRADHYIGGELYLTRELDGVDALVEGFPDHIERENDPEHGDVLVSEDWKTGWKAEITPSNQFQGEIIDWLMLENFGHELTVGYRVRFVRKNRASDLYVVRPNEIGRIEAHLRALIARIREARAKKFFPATPGAHCAYCPISAQCREYNVLVQANVIVADRVSAQRAAGDLLIIDAASNQRTAQLKEYVANNGPVSIGGARFDFVDEGGKNPVIADVAGLIQALGIPAAISARLVDAPDDPRLEDPEVAAQVYGYGAAEAVRMRLLAVNGRRTSSEDVQNDPRLAPLWRPGKAREVFKATANATPLEGEGEDADHDENGAENGAGAAP